MFRAKPNIWIVLSRALIVSSILLCSLIILGGTAKAQPAESNNSASSGSEISGYVPENYEYVVKPGNNQTLLVRRSLQLYDQASPAINLSPAQLIYAETNVVQEMGARDLIHPEEIVEVMSELVAQYAVSSQELSSDVLSAWQTYADNARFEIEEITPSNVEISDDGKIIEDGAEPDIKFSPDSEAQSVESSDDSSWLVWLIVPGVLAILGYVFWQSNDADKR